MTATPTPGPRHLSVAVLAGVAVLFISGMLSPSLLVLGAMTGSQLAQLFEMGGRGYMLVTFLSGGLAVTTAAITVGLAAYHRRVPAAVALAAAVIPWLAGFTFTRLALARMFEAVAMVNPHDKALILSVGTGEAVVTRLFGAAGAACVLVGCAVGLLVAALRARMVQRGDALAFVAGAVTSFGLAIVAMSAALESAHLSAVLQALGNVNPSDRWTLVAAGIGGVGTAHASSTVGLVIAAAGLLGWFGARQPPQLVGAVLAAALIAGIVLLDRATLSPAREAARRRSVPDRVAALQLPEGEGQDVAGPAELFAETDGYSEPEGQPQPWSAAPLCALMKEKRPVTVAADVRVDAVGIRALFGCAEAAGLERLDLIVRAPAGPDVADQARWIALEPLLAMSAPPTAERLYLPASLQPEEEAVVGKLTEGGLAVGATVLQRAEEFDPFQQPADFRVVLIALPDRVTLQELVVANEAAAQRQAKVIFTTSGR